MPVHFDRERMEKVADVYDRWWRGELDRSLVRGVVENVYPRAGVALAPFPDQSNCHDFSWTAEQIIDTVDYRLSSNEYIGDGFPVLDFAFYGPGVVAAFCGAKLDNSSGQVWFFPPEEDPDLSELHIKYDPNNKWSRRIKDIYRAGLERWNGSVIMGFPDLGGVMDIVASMVGTENLLYALIDEPEEVDRLVREAQSAWYEAYNDFAEALKPQGFYTDWNGLLSREPAYILQCDFCYMMGPDMFRRFVLPTLQEDVRRLTNTIYHLDGIGELPHLDQILSIPELNAVQWVYGTGQPGPYAWLDVYKKILNAGKQIMIIENGMDNGYEELRPHLGRSPYVCIWATPETRDRAMKIVEMK